MLSVSEHAGLDMSKPPSQMTLVEVAEQLERVTSWIEGERVKEREARQVYDVIRQQVEARIDQIKAYTQELVRHQHMKMSGFAGLLGQKQEVAAVAEGARRPSPAIKPGERPKNLAEAIAAIWSLDKYAEPLTTEEIGEALTEVGYTTDAAPTSIKSSVNQALAKLCRVGRVIRLRADGSRIAIKDTTSRARKYVAAYRLGDEVL
ncbi:MAG: hypothetical protein FJ255_09130 [Phycisphaerae bacterium]|nr:hypothetical protein [Phycisphaerae bacterium]